MSKKQYEVVSTYGGRRQYRRTHKENRFASLSQAEKERDRRNATDQLVWHNADSVLHSFNGTNAQSRSAYEVTNQSTYRWRVWNHTIRDYAD